MEYTLDYATKLVETTRKEAAILLPNFIADFKRELSGYTNLEKVELIQNKLKHSRNLYDSYTYLDVKRDTPAQIITSVLSTLNYANLDYILPKGTKYNRSAPKEKIVAWLLRERLLAHSFVQYLAKWYEQIDTSPNPWGDWKLQVFNLKLTPAKERHVYSLMLTNEIIECSMAEFSGVFGEGPFIDPLQWLRSQTLLVYFLNSLKGHIHDAVYDTRYMTAKMCLFYVKHNDINNTQLARSSDNLHYTKKDKPKHSHLVDEVMSLISS